MKKRNLLVGLIVIILGWGIGFTNDTSAHWYLIGTREHWHIDALPTRSNLDPIRHSDGYIRSDGCEKSPVISRLGGTNFIKAPDNVALHPKNGGELIVTHNLRAANGQVEAFLWCPPGTAAKNNLTETVSAEDESIIAKVLTWLIFVFALFGTWLLQITGAFLSIVISAKEFTTHPAVQNGWPFIQGIANFGYIIALLYIAFVTILRSGSADVRRLLPRLLIAALLTNFSLVLTGIIIDASRLVMAIIMEVVLGARNLESIGLSVIKGSGVVDAVFIVDKEAAVFGITLKDVVSNWDRPVNALKATLLIYGLLVGLIVVTVGLFMRYVLLLLLLIASPVAFLGFAFPGLEGMAKKWWSSFITYVLYGPIALFVLALIVKMNNAAVLGGVADPFLKAVVELALTVAMCFAATIAAKKIGGLGADAAINWSKWGGKKISAPARWAGSGAAWTGKQAAQGAYIFSGARDKVRNVQDYVRESKRQFQKKYKLGSYDKYTAEGELKKGKTSGGQMAARRAWDPGIKAAEAATKRSDTAITYDKLIKPDVRYSLNETVTNDIFAAKRADVDYDEALQQMRVLIQDMDFVDNKMTDSQKAAALANGDTREAMLRTMRGIAQREAAKK